MFLKLSKMVLLAAVIFSLVSCYVPFNRKHFHLYYSAGIKAVDKGDLRGARRNFGRALTNAESGHMKPSIRADVLFHYARVLGNLCEHQTAEKEFLRARELTGKISGDEGRFKRYHINAELGRLNFDIGRYSRSIPYYEEAVSLAVEFPDTQTPPPGFEKLLTDYSDALMDTGNHQKAEIVRKRLESLPGGNSGNVKHSVHSGITEGRYPRECRGSGKVPKGHKHDQH